MSINRIMMVLLLSISTLMAGSNTIKIILPDSSVFRGERIVTVNDSLAMYRGNVRTIDFSKYQGFFDQHVSPIAARLTNGSDDTVFITAKNTYLFQNEVYTHKGYIMQYIFTGSLSSTDYIRSKFYDNAKQRWTISIRSTNGDYVNGRSYNTKKHYLIDISDNVSYDNLMWSMCFMLLVGSYMWIFPFSVCAFVIPQERWGVHFMRALVLLLLGLPVSSVFFIDRFTQLQLAWPLLSIWIVPCLLHFLNPKREIVAVILRCSLCCTITFFWLYVQFFNLHETTELADGSQIELNWKPGTDVLKRYTIKRILANMVPVPVNDHGENYVVYTSKYEFTEGEVAVLNDDIAGWIAYLLYDDVIDDFSYREAQIILQIIHNLCDVKLDFLSFKEWQSACLFKNHAPHNIDKDADDGEENAYGLVNIAGNVPEYTSDYCLTFKLGLTTDTLIKAYSDVFVAGSAYISKDSINNSVVNKNLREGSVGFRLVYRPSDIGARRFYIKGTCRADQAVRNLPKYIKLISLNGHKIETLDNYESFEELLIESRYKKCIIEGINQLNSKYIKFIQPPGFAFYDYEPIFSFVGMDN